MHVNKDEALSPVNTREIHTSLLILGMLASVRYRMLAGSTHPGAHTSCALCTPNSASHVEFVVTISENMLQLSTIRSSDHEGFEGTVTLRKAIKSLFC